MLMLPRRLCQRHSEVRPFHEHSVKVCDQSSVYCGVFVVTIDNFSFGCRFVFASNRFRRFGFDVFPDWLSSTNLTNDVGFPSRNDILVDMESSCG